MHEITLRQPSADILYCSLYFFSVRARNETFSHRIVSKYVQHLPLYLGSDSLERAIPYVNVRKSEMENRRKRFCYVEQVNEGKR